MDEQFINEFIAVINEDVPDIYLDKIRKRMSLFINDYNVSKKSTELSIYNGCIPDCYNIYMVTRKVEGLSMNTLKLYNNYLLDFFRKVNKPLNKISTNDIRVYLYRTQEERGISNRTLEGRRNAINTFLQWCVSEEYISKNPCCPIKAIKYTRKDVEPLSPIELEQVRNACETIREKAIIETLYSTACRVTELENLKISDIDFERKEVHLFGKGSKYRTSYMNARMELALKEYLACRKENNDKESLIISNRYPYHKIKKTAIEKIVRQIGVKSGIGRRLFPHLIRHTTATDGLERRMDVTELQTLLGHSTINTTMIYAKVSDNKIKNNHRVSIV